MANKQIKDLIILGDEKSTVFTKTWDDNSRVKKIVIPSGVNKIDTESNFAGLFDCIVEISEELWKSELFQKQVYKSHDIKSNSTLIIFKIMRKDGGYHFSYFDYQDNFGEMIDYSQGFGSQYDEYIDDELLRQWNTDLNVGSKVMVRLCRIATPYMLSDEHKKKFITYLKRMYMNGIESIAEFDCPELLNCLFQNGIVKPDKICEIKKILEDNNATNCLAECNELLSLDNSIKKTEASKKMSAMEKKIKKEGLKSNDILPSRDMKSRKYDVSKIGDNEYKVECGGSHTVLECDGYFCCDCYDYKKTPQNCNHIIAVKRFLGDPYVRYKKANFKVAPILPKSATKEDRLEEMVSLLKDAYKGVKTYSFSQIMDEQPNLSENTLKTLVKAVYNTTPAQFFKSIGIVSEIEYYDVKEDIVAPEALKGKKCVLCFSYTFEIEEALNMLGAQIVTSESPEIDYVFIKLKDGVQKEPPSDDKIVRELFERRENNEIKFKILAKDFFA